MDTSEAAIVMLLVSMALLLRALFASQLPTHGYSWVRIRPRAVDPESFRRTQLISVGGALASGFAAIILFVIS